MKQKSRSEADQKRANQATMDLYAALAGKPTVQLAPVRPKRAPTAAPRTEPSEHDMQVALMHWWRRAHATFGLPEFALYAVPNAAKRDVALAARMKAEGLRAGIPDLFLAAPRLYGCIFWCGLYIEMKAGRNKCTDEQETFLEYAASAGYATRVCYSTESAIDAIKNYLDNK